MRQGSFPAFFVAALALLAGCAGNSGAPTGMLTAESNASSGARAPAMPGDQVVLRIWDEPEMSDTFRIAESGELTLPRLGVFRVGTQSVAQLQDSLRALYTGYLRNQSVEVSVLRRVGVMGEVRNPGVYPSDLTMNVPDLIARAGGVTEAGDMRDVILVRDGERVQIGRDQQLFVNTEMRSGDFVIVGQRSWFARNPVAAISAIVTTVGYIATVIIPALR